MEGRGIIMAEKVLKNVSLVGREEIIPHADILIEEGRISKIWDRNSGREAGERNKKEAEMELNLKGQYYALPGFIDTHIHGAFGSDITDGSPEAWEDISRYKLSQGTTGYLGTVLTGPREETEKLCRDLGRYIKKGENLNLIGVHIEGPYINKEKKGAQNEAYIRKPSLEEVRRWHELLGDGLKLISLAPELKGSRKVIEYASDSDIVTGAVHTSADYEDMQQAFAAGLELGVHLFNGMKGLHHRRPGVVGAFLEDEEMPVEIIADGIHLHPAVIRMVFNCKGSENVLAITDAMRAAGMPAGSYDLGGLEVEIEGNEARLEDGSLAGSTLTMNRALKNLISFTGLDLIQAAKPVSHNPARLLGLNDRGLLEEGRRADIVLLDENLDVCLTMLEGDILYDERE